MSRETKSVKLSSLVGATYNPRQRTLKIVQLARSMEKLGMLDPIKITSSNKIVDGHRRVAAASKLGWKEIECLVLPEDVNPETAFAELNAAQNKLTGNQSLQVWLKNPEAVTTKARNDFESAKELLGPKILARMATQGFSIRIVRLARELVRYLGQDDEEGPLVARAVKYFMDHKNVQLIRSYMVLGQDPKVLDKAVRLGREIKTNLAIA